MNNEERLEIEGLAGQRVLSGTIHVGGAKNAILKALASTILFADEVNLTNVPDIEDVRQTVKLLADLGGQVSAPEKHSYLIDTQSLDKTVIAPEISKKLRASIVLTGPLLARFGRVSFPHPGGCVIGKRPIDLFLEGFKAMGAKVELKNELYEIASTGSKLHGANIFFKNISVTATETFLMAAILAEGKTVLKNCALEPEIVSLGEFLKKCGAQISGLGTPTIEIVGGDLLLSQGQIYQTVPDRIEAGSFLVLAGLLAKDMTIADCRPDHLDAVIEFLHHSGVKMEIGENYIRVRDNDSGNFVANDLKTHEYPGFPTDLQAPMTVFLTQAKGQSFVFETIFEGRLNHLESLERMGAKVKILDSHRAIIDGPSDLSGRELISPDLRAGLAYIISGLVAKGQTNVHNVGYIDRGYEDIEGRLNALGANIKRIRI
ncbi:MAG: UDP-N-acetylglucosamine 1-carboxyvinyltransferase [Candidatus Paceibacterota bacterium]|jgi:UDP-N-acetylglucosamine 1-carboxyvinyltransferase